MLVDMMIVGFLSFGVVQKIFGKGRLSRRLASIAFIGGAVWYGYVVKGIGWEVVSFANGLILFGPIILVVLLFIGKNFHGGRN